ncbi:efflux transporter outer membrane subunit [Xylophilus sp. GW821-FHT01B05]
MQASAFAAEGLDFGSDELRALLARGALQSLDLAAAQARVRQAQAQARIAGAALLPELAGNLAADRQARLGGQAVDGSSYSAGLSARYELDFWGRNRALQDSALQSLRASAFDRDTVRLTVTAGIASLWLQAVGLQERSDIAGQNLASAQRLLAAVESRARAGAASPLELAQQRGLVAGQQRSLAALRQQAGDARTALAVLLGGPVPGAAPGPASLATLRLPVWDAGLPSQLLTRRPDIARAEAALAAANANIAAARAAMLPSLSLTAGIGLGSDRLRTLADNPLASLAAGLTVPIFNAGRLAAGRDLAQAQREELLANYQQSIVAAFGDAEVALNAVGALDAQIAAQTEEHTQAERAFTLAESRYRAGAETLLTLLDVQRTLYAAQEAAVQLRLERLQASVGVYRAFGGGWRQVAKIS